MRNVWLEVALNGPWSRGLQPRIPVSVAEIVRDGIACAKAGAAILHVHAYDESSGRQKDDWETYARIIQGIRDEVDAIVYPTIPLGGGATSQAPLNAKERFAAVEELAKRGLIEWAVVDPGSLNFSHAAQRAAGKEGFLYLNPEDHIRRGLELAAAYGFHPSYACYEPGFVRLGAALHAEAAGCPQPVYRFMFSDDFAFSFPLRSYGLSAYQALLAETAPGAPWMLAGLALDPRPLWPEVLAAGGHLRVGLEDSPLGDRRDNLWWLEEALAAIAEAKAAPATAEEIREALKR